MNWRVRGIEGGLKFLVALGGVGRGIVFIGRDELWFYGVVNFEGGRFGWVFCFGWFKFVVIVRVLFKVSCCNKLL